MTLQNLTSAVRDFMEIGGQSIDGRNRRQAALYVGLIVEELAEMLQALDIPVWNTLEEVSRDLKKGAWDHKLDCDDVPVIDAAIDLAWVSIGLVYSLGADAGGAVREVIRSNMSKFEGCEVCGCTGGFLDEFHGRYEKCGKCHGHGLIAGRDSDGKIQKSRNYSAPDLAPFVSNESRYAASANEGSDV